LRPRRPWACINAFIAYLQTPEGLKELPPEYASLALEVPLNFPPKPFTFNDIVAKAGKPISVQ